jgi:hypothetical protein
MGVAHAANGPSHAFWTPVSTEPYTGWRDAMALPVYGRANGLTRRWWLDALARLGLSERAAVGALDRIVAAAEPWLGRLSEVASTNDQRRSFGNSSPDGGKNLLSLAASRLGRLCGVAYARVARSGGW